MPTLALQSALAAVFLVPLSTAAAGGDQQVAVQVGAQRRTCVVHLPPNDDGKRPLPLLIAFHGAGGTGQGFMGTFSALADRQGFIAACPDGIVGHNRGWKRLGQADPRRPRGPAHDVQRRRFRQGLDRSTARLVSHRPLAGVRLRPLGGAT